MVKSKNKEEFENEMFKLPIFRGIIVKIWNCSKGENHMIFQLIASKGFSGSPQAGFEPTTRWLTAICSTAELLKNLIISLF